MTLFRSLIAAFLLVPVLVTSAMAQGTYQIREGDILRLEVLEDASLNRDLIVLPDGSISVPFVGPVTAGGRTISQVQSTISAGLAPSFAEAPTVFLGVSSLFEPDEEEIEEETIGVYVIGEVPEPGKREIEPGTTVLQFLAEMGGFGDFAATKRVQLRTTRTGVEQIYTLNYEDIELGAAVGLSAVMVEGDVIVVPQRRLFE